MAMETSAEARATLAGLLDRGPLAVVWHEGSGSGRLCEETKRPRPCPTEPKMSSLSIDVRLCILYHRSWKGSGTGEVHSLDADRWRGFPLLWVTGMT